MDVQQALILDALAIVGAFFGIRGLRTLIYGLRRINDDEGPVLMIRGGRGVLVAVGCAVIAGALIWDNRPMLYFGIAFLAEELYETTMALGVVSWDYRQRNPGKVPPTGPPGQET